MTEAKENVIEITFNGKPIKGVELADGVVRRATRSGATSCMVRCSQTGKWLGKRAFKSGQEFRWDHWPQIRQSLTERLDLFTDLC